MTTTKYLAATAAVLMASSAFAADLPRRNTAPAAPVVQSLPTFVWTGFYAGVNAGYGFGNITGSAGPNFKDPSGFLGGAQIGYNYQVGSMVYGLETDLAYADIRAKNNATGVAGSKNTLGYIGTVRGRVGVAFDRFLPYLTGGFAYGGSSITVPGLGKSTPVHYGWTLGGGMEYAITNNLTAKVEALYVDLSDQRVLGNARKSGFETGIVRAGINAKF
jgi:outer membrane immunogenic protein